MEYKQKGLCSQLETALHTHDRIAFKRCRRKWMFSSPFQMHLQPKATVIGVNKNLWFGSAIHFAMEDYHGFNKFGDPVEAFNAYIEAHEPEEVPNEIEELILLGTDMLSYYREWEKKKAKWKTVWVDGKPLVEVNFSLVLDELCYYTVKPEFLLDSDADLRVTKYDEIWYVDDAGFKWNESQVVYHEIVYHGTFDRIVEDDNGDWWILDYKTAKSFDTGKLALDPQISSYCWAAEQWFQREIKGMVYLQISKSPPKPPKKTTKGISTDKRQRTTHTLYRTALIEEYGSVQQAPSECVRFLNDLASEESENGDDFIRFDLVPRNEEAKINTYRYIIGEGKDMLSPKMSIYPNPTKDCSWDCPFMPVCLAMDEGADWEYLLEDFELRNETMKDELPKWKRRMYKKNRELFPDEYDQYCKEGVNSLEEFIAEGEK